MNLSDDLLFLQNPLLFNESQPELRAMIAHQAATCLFTVFGNLLMIFVILRNNRVMRKKRITPVQMLMLHMCTSDLLFALLTIFPTMIITITVPTFYGPDLLCKLVKCLQVLPMYSSSFMLVAISADRYYAICRPLANIRSGRYNRPALYAAIAWFSALLFSTPQFLIFGKNEHNDCVGLYTETWQYPVYVICFNVVVWLIPTTIAGCLYTCVCRAVWKSMAFEKRPSNVGYDHKSSLRMKYKKHKLYNEDEHLQLSTKLLDHEDQSRRASRHSTTLVHHSGLRIQREELDRKRVQTVKLTLTIVAANFILWAPFNVISVIDALTPTFLSPVFATYIMFFGNLNSSVNPWIWFFFNRDMVKVALSPFFEERKLKGKLPLNSVSEPSENQSQHTKKNGYACTHSSTITTVKV
ncbi:unnamed protein product [Bursaphelenchus okinawaensis]|uniref:G-protein coupled receptors family 1 profile domain-containing protein n=1 Tax=Bursaphelenchus okinawaensis TaxID=465554 RepID=A0A811LQ81_9BILA|nr:unnamed protein product [Bursaphelenchus okinawaensis]CAG9125540.1 unnamed protein product [Bursaphelenchus okinawaensis]